MRRRDGMRMAVVLNLPQSRSARAAAFLLRAELHGLADVELADLSAADPTSRWEGHRRMIVHLSEPALARPLKGKSNLLVSLRESALALTPAEVAVLRACDAGCFTSEDHARQAAAASGMRSFILPPAPGPAFLEVNPIRSLLAAQGKKVRILWLASKRPEEWAAVAMAWRRVADAGLLRQASLTVLTHGVRVTGEFVSQAALAGMQVDARPLSADTEAAEAMAEHDVFVATQTGGDGLGIPALEAQASGCLLVAPAAGVLTAIAAKGRAVPVATPDDLWRSIATAVQGWGTPAVEELRLAGCAAARAMTWRRAAERLMQVVRETCWRGLRVAG